jgi:hypothetical protein
VADDFLGNIIGLQTKEALFDCPCVGFRWIRDAIEDVLGDVKGERFCVCGGRLKILKNGFKCCQFGFYAVSLV